MAAPFMGGSLGSIPWATARLGREEALRRADTRPHRTHDVERCPYWGSSSARDRDGRVCTKVPLVA
jgi:hypothetical protein